jgi:hypothetical protein
MRMSKRVCSQTPLKFSKDRLFGVTTQWTYATCIIISRGMLGFC